MFEKTKINEKEGEDGPFFKKNTSHSIRVLLLDRRDALRRPELVERGRAERPREREVRRDSKRQRQMERHTVLILSACLRLQGTQA